MKKIIFVIESMNVGGTEKALLSLFSVIDRKKYEITLLILEKNGGFIKEIPKGINVRYIDNYENIKEYIKLDARSILNKEIEMKEYYQAFKTLYSYGISRLINNYYFYFNNKVMSKFSCEKEKYDIAVSFQGPPSHFSAYYVANKIKARKKIQWIHSDVTYLNLHKKTVETLYKKFDKFFIVSNESKEKFLSMFPVFREKSEVFLNILSQNSIYNKAQEGIGFNDNFNGIRILTVGRLSGEKGQAMTIPILYKLKEEGYNIRWYCLGDGPLRDKYTDLIKKYNIEKDFILLGNKINPYPYFNECDIYVQPSKFEGYCITLAEARMFNKPIVTTSFSGAKEQLKDKYTGLIVEYNENEIYKSVKKLLDDKELRQNLIDNLKSEKIDTTKEINKLYNVVE